MYYYRMLPSGMWGEITKGKYNLLLSRGFHVKQSTVKLVYVTLNEYFK